MAHSRHFVTKTCINPLDITSFLGFLKGSSQDFGLISQTIDKRGSFSCLYAISCPIGKIHNRIAPSHFGRDLPEALPPKHKPNLSLTFFTPCGSISKKTVVCAIVFCIGSMQIIVYRIKLYFEGVRYTISMNNTFILNSRTD